uniref:Uncharacterized protein n=1 Tax=Cannabis sativa TaxID=3483 RepID=A0A803R914_CANSA
MRHAWQYCVRVRVNWFLVIWMRDLVCSTCNCLFFRYYEMASSTVGVKLRKRRKQNSINFFVLVFAF